jgi:hypothetical protein
LDIPEDYYTAISNASEATGEGHATNIDHHDLLYLFEYYRITKISGANSLYACAEWPGIHIPPAILSLLDRKGLQFTFFNEKRLGEDHMLLYYERNAGDAGSTLTTSRRTSPTSSGMQWNCAT